MGANPINSGHSAGVFPAFIVSAEEELEGFRHDVEQFSTCLSVVLPAYTNIGSEEYDSRGGV